MSRGGGDHAEFMAFARRILRAASRRGAVADPEDLVELVALRAVVDEAIDNAARAVHAGGASWGQIGEATGMTKQAAHKRWGRQPEVDGGSANPGAVAAVPVVGTRGNSSAGLGSIVGGAMMPRIPKSST